MRQKPKYFILTYFESLVFHPGLHHVPRDREGEQGAGVSDPHAGVAGAGGVRLPSHPRTGEPLPHRGTALSGHTYLQSFLTVLRIRIRILVLDPDPLVRGMDPNPDPSIIKQK
jgi:hypothetical protein